MQGEGQNVQLIYVTVLQDVVVITLVKVPIVMQTKVVEAYVVKLEYVAVHNQVLVGQIICDTLGSRF